MEINILKLDLLHSLVIKVYAEKWTEVLPPSNQIVVQKFTNRERFRPEQDPEELYQSDLCEIQSLISRYTTVGDKLHLSSSNGR